MTKHIPATKLYVVITHEAGREYNLGEYTADSKEEVVRQVLEKYPNFSDWTHQEQIDAVKEKKDEN